MLILRPLLRHLFNMPEQRERVLKLAGEHGIAPEVLKDANAWVPARFYYALFELAAATGEGAAESVRQASLSAMCPEDLGSLHILFRAFGTPTSAYSRYAIYLNSLQEIGRYELHVLHNGAATISFTPVGKLPHQGLDCLYRQGALEAIPTLWHLPPARITHECCLNRGHASCIYELTWVPFGRRRMAWLAAGAGLGIGALVAGGMKLTGTLPTSALLVAGLVAPWPILGYLAGKSVLLTRQLKDTSQLMAEQVSALERELRNVWEKHGDIEKRADRERKVRSLFQRYVPAPVVERALEEDSRKIVAGERVEVTVLFADLVGFTPYAEKTPPEQVMLTVNRYLARFAEVVNTYGGVVDKFMGDNLMAVFGAPVLDPYGPEKAVNCAQHLLKTLREVNAQTGLDFQLRIGIHHGPAVAGHVGSADRINYTVMGDTVNLAQRLQAASDPGKIMLSDAVRARCDNSRAFLPRGNIAVRGHQGEVPAYELD